MPPFKSSLNRPNFGQAAKGLMAKREDYFGKRKILRILIQIAETAKTDTKQLEAIKLILMVKASGKKLSAGLSEEALRMIGGSLKPKAVQTLDK